MTADCLIFSRDRACQLDLLLQSIERYASHLYRSLVCLWWASTADFDRGYRLLTSPAIIVEQTDFEQDTRGWLDRAGDTVSFLVDDDIFYKPAPAPSELPWTFRFPRTTRWHDWELDTAPGWPLSLDGNIFEKRTLLPLLGFRFSDPNELESGLMRRKHLFVPELVHSGGQCLVGIPANRVTQSRVNPASDDPATSTVGLNARFLAGERLSLDRMDFRNVAGPHCPVVLVFG